METNNTAAEYLKSKTGATMNATWVKHADGTFVASLKTNREASEIVGRKITVTAKSGKIDHVTIIEVIEIVGYGNNDRWATLRVAR